MKKISKLIALLSILSLQSDLHAPRVPRKGKRGKVQIVKFPYQMHKIFLGKEMSRGAQSAKWTKCAKKDEHAHSLQHTLFAVTARGKKLRTYYNVTNAHSLREKLRKYQLVCLTLNKKTALQALQSLNGNQLPQISKKGPSEEDVQKKKDAAAQRRAKKKKKENRSLEDSLKAMERFGNSFTVKVKNKK